MKTVKSIIIFCITFIFLAALCLFTFAAASEDLTYTDRGAYIEITSCEKSAESVVILSEFNGKPVTTIAKSAFEDCTELKTIFIPKSVLSINNGAFSGCDKLIDVYYDGTNEQFDSIYTYSNNETLWYVNLHPMHQHTVSAWVQSVPLGQYTDGEEKGFCDYCGYEISRVIKNTHTHERNYTVTKKATCTTNGKAEFSCPCGYSYSEVILAKGHSFKTEIITENNLSSHANCTHGTLYFYKCDNCDLFSDTLTFSHGNIDYDNHTFGDEYIIDKEVTCTENGKMSRHCIYCNQSFDTQIIESTGHKIKIDKYGTAATCTNNGKTDSTSCTVCKEVLTVQEVIPAKGHTEIIIPGRAATCSAVGLTDGKRCSVCDKTILKQYEITKTAHVESEWIVQKTATEKATGIEIKRCTLCNKKLEERVIPVQEAKYILGDINGDGKVTASDARIILRIATKLENASKYKNAQVIADVNGDGKISSLDARKVLRVASRLESF